MTFELLRSKSSIMQRVRPETFLASVPAFPVLGLGTSEATVSRAMGTLLPLGDPSHLGLHHNAWKIDWKTCFFDRLFGRKNARKNARKKNHVLILDQKFFPGILSGGLPTPFGRPFFPGFFKFFPFFLDPRCGYYI